MGSTGRSEPAPVLSRARVRVQGRVQGVFFRASAAQQAADRGLAGWVRNEADGSVVAVFQGSRADVDDLIDWCHRGPPAARVTKVTVEWQPPVAGEARFSLQW